MFFSYLSLLLPSYPFQIILPPPLPFLRHFLFSLLPSLPHFFLLILISLFLSLQSPSFARVRPERGPVSGGTRLTVTGRHLDAGSSVSVFIEKEECLFVKSVMPPPPPRYCTAQIL